MKSHKADDELNRLLNEIERAKKTLAFESDRAIAQMDDDFRHAVELYASQLQAMRTCDYDDLILDVLDLFRTSNWPVDLYRQMYSSVLVDEAQDLNAAQYALIRTLCAQGIPDVAFCADERQGIFSFNGADIGLIHQFEKDFGAKRRQLTLSFRCGREIVVAANVVTSNIHRGIRRLEAGAKGLAVAEVRIVPAADEDAEARSAQPATRRRTPITRSR